MGTTVLNEPDFIGQDHCPSQHCPEKENRLCVCVCVCVCVCREREKENLSNCLMSPKYIWTSCILKCA